MNTAVKLNTNGFKNYQRRNPITLKVQGFFYTISLVLDWIKIRMIGSNGRKFSSKLNSPITKKEEPIYTKEIIPIKKKSAKVLKFKSKKRRKKREPFFKIHEIDITAYRPFLLPFAKYLIMLISCLLIVFGVLFLYSNRIITLLVEKHNIFQTEKVNDLVKENLTPITAQVERLTDKVTELDAGATIIYHKIKPPRRYEVMGKKNTFIWR